MDRIDQREVTRARTSAPKIMKQAKDRNGTEQVDFLEDQITQRELL